MAYNGDWRGPFGQHSDGVLMVMSIALRWYLGFLFNYYLLMRPFSVLCEIIYTKTFPTLVIRIYPS